ncbi:ATP-binding protein [Mangrovibacillus cuniculi]|uniref:histidine kinase n=1 Tax=Mangrovibacillus cuniculi TaxID=2593652 RepID=A0A7S8HFF7_9BACI|nr:ATP-binding protein [Mangrovibacillus cuniculi]QPC46476.1 response regulator [Mangrovibacillus cuniculi]
MLSYLTDHQPSLMLIAILTLIMGIITNYQLFLTGSTLFSKKIYHALSVAFVLTTTVWSFHYLSILAHPNPYPSEIHYDVLFYSFLLLFIPYLCILPLMYKQVRGRWLWFYSIAFSLCVHGFHLYGMNAIILQDVIQPSTTDILFTLFFGTVLTYLSKWVFFQFRHKWWSILLFSSSIMMTHFYLMFVTADGHVSHNEINEATRVSTTEMGLLLSISTFSVVGIYSCLLYYQYLLSKKEENRLEHQIDSIYYFHPGLVVELDEENCIIRTNPTFKKWFGIAHTEIGVNKFEEIVVEKDRKSVMGYIEQVHKGHATSFEAYLYLNGVEKFVEGTIFPIFIQKKLKRIAIQTFDQTKRKEQEEALRTSNQSLIIAKSQAEQANQEKSEFISHVSHELRTPLNSILGYTQLFADLLPMGSKEMDMANKINRAGNHLLSVFNDLLDFSKADNGKITISAQQMSITNLVKDSIRLVNVLAEEKNKSLLLRDHASSNAVIHIDGTRFRQIILNLLTNAIKYGATNDEIDILIEEMDEFMKVSVTDHGKGIPKEELEAVFQPFYRLRRTNEEGSGLGLALVKKLTEKMNGKCGAYSIQNSHTTFWVKFPIVKGMACQKSMSDKQILYIEDTLGNIDIMESCFESKNLGELSVALTGKMGIHFAKLNIPDLILLDLGLPDIDGYDVLQFLKSHEDTKDIPIIVITAIGESEKEKSIHAGADDFLTKPFLFEDLEQKLKFYVNKKKTLH